MIHAYNESYLNDAKQNLAECFNYAITTCHFEPTLFSKLFVQSGYADKFERGNPAIVAGMSGIELAQKVIIYAYPNWNFPKRIFSEDRSNVYWTGWALAEYQWETSKRFKDIFSKISCYRTGNSLKNDSRESRNLTNGAFKTFRCKASFDTNV